MTSSGVGVTDFVHISPFGKGAIETLARCLNIEYARNHIPFHLFHPPLTRTQSAAPLSVPGEFMANPKKVGVAKHIGSRRLIICHSALQKEQTMLCFGSPCAGERCSA